jgi:DNA-binding NtrC family response regulator
MESVQRSFQSKVLIYDPNPIVRKFLTVNLKHRQYSIIEAESIPSFRFLAGEQKPSLMLLGLSPFQIDGGILADLSLDSLLSRIPIILVLSQSLYDFMDDLPLPPNVSAALTLPVPVQLLVEEVARAISQSKTPPPRAIIR